MYTLIEIFDSKQYENIISPVSSGDISKIIYIGTTNTMTDEKVKNIKAFFTEIDYHIPLDFFYVERDNPDSVLEILENILKNNQSCIIDITGGEDVLLVCAGMIAQKHSIPLIRTNAKDGQRSLIYKCSDVFKENKPGLKVSDFITLQGGKIRSGESIYGFSTSDSHDIKTLFKVNSADCEAYSIFCNFAAEFISVEKGILSFSENVIRNKNEQLRNSILKILELLCKFSLLEKTGDFSYKINSRIVSVCLKKSGNVLEYYTALALYESRNLFSDIRVGTTIEWNDTSTKLETHNEIDVLAVSDNIPVFISCKNGDVKKEALYELDTVSRALGGAYTKKILVCTYISDNSNSRSHFIKRAEDMGIYLIYDTHKKNFDEFLYYLKNSVK